MKDIIDKNYFLEKISKDKEIVDLLHKQTSKENVEFFDNLKELRRILHLKTKTDKKILLEYDKLIIIPTGSEDTLIRELNQFNRELYDNLPEHYILNFENQKNKIDNTSINLKKIDEKNILNISEPFKENSSLELDDDILYTKEMDPLVEKTIQDFGESISKESNQNNFLKNLLKEDNFQSEVLKNSEEIYVESNEEKDKMLLDIKDSLSEGNYKKLNLTKPFSLSTTKYMKKLEKIKKGFEDTYGSELFKKISKWVHKENQLYENIENNKKISNLKERKINLTKKRKFKK
ncbi:hypothetical protein [Spiroplasma endosymbiont of Cantharis rufa]|uniref:hypothetical protein n=1 Tax=Spiroplasma endosymbiont of Cantharis rufa TaxID=3066279 RepID=UPI0030D556C6